MRRFVRALLIGALVAAVANLVMSCYGQPGKWISSAGLLFDIAGVLQLELSGLFDMLLEVYGDEEKYPYGPPSHITREIIDNPDTPFLTWLRNTFFFEHRTGIQLLGLGFALQYVGGWI